MNGWHRFLVAATAVPLLEIAAAGVAELPPDSYYQLDVSLETQEGESLRFSEMQGTPVIVAMFYGSCPHVCPMIISTIRTIEGQLPPQAREQLRVVMITLDPERDTPAALAELADRHRVDHRRWRFARTSQADVRSLAAVLGVKYRALPDGGFNHTSPLILLDKEGREIARSEKQGMPDPTFVQQILAAIPSTQTAQRFTAPESPVSPGPADTAAASALPRT